MRIRMLKPREVVSALKRAGFEELRQVGSHRVMTNLQGENRLTVAVCHIE